MSMLSKRPTFPLFLALSTLIILFAWMLRGKVSSPPSSSTSSANSRAPAGSKSFPVSGVNGVVRPPRPSATSASLADDDVISKTTKTTATTTTTGDWTHVIVLTTVTSPDAIAYSGAPPHATGLHCVSKPSVGGPIFGEQCTMHKKDALRACLATPACVSITSPDEMTYGVRSDLGTNGPLAQLRNTHSLAWAKGTDLEKKHVMCSPGGCENVFVTRIPRDRVAPSLIATLDSFAPKGMKTLIAAPRSLSARWYEKWGLHTHLGDAERGKSPRHFGAWALGKVNIVSGKQIQDEMASALGAGAERSDYVWQSSVSPIEWAEVSDKLAIFATNE